MISFDATSVATPSSGTLTWAHTNAGNLLVVGLAQAKNPQQNPSTVTFNGVGMTRIPVNGFDGVAGSSFLYFLENPSVGTFNIVATFAGGANNVGCASSYFGARLTNQPDSYDGQPEGGASNTIYTYVQQNNCWQILTAIVDGFSGNSINTTGTGWVDRQASIRNGTGIGNVYMCLSDSNGIVPSGNQPASWAVAHAGGGGYGITISIAATNSYYQGNALFFAGD